MVWGYVRGLWISGREERLAASQASLLRGLPAEVTTEDVSTGPDGHTIHTIRVRRASADREQRAGGAPIVCVHGYGMGAASWSGSLTALASTGAEVFSIDWPGSGRSSRPRFPLGRGVDACEDFFVDRIEAWRKSLGIERMVLLGHSFGGYFSACYAMKHPEHVQALILASPVGMGEKKAGSPYTDRSLRADLPWTRYLFVNTAEYLWGAYWTPQAVVRVLGPWGRWPVDSYWSRRFERSRQAGTANVDFDAAREYTYQLAAQPACAEYCLGELLDFGAWARRPVGRRLIESFRACGDRAPPTSLLYGEHDWMDAGTGVELARSLGRDTAVYRVEGAGHQIFLENPAAFNAAALRALAGMNFLGADAAARDAIANAAAGPLLCEADVLPASVPGVYQRL